MSMNRTRYFNVGKGLYRWYYLKVMPLENFKNPGEQKIDEYVSRIQAGESVDKIIEGLPDSIKKIISERLSIKSVDLVKSDVEVIIPTQLRDQPAEILEEMWQLNLNSDPEIAKKQIEERQRIIDKRRYEEEQEKKLFAEQKIKDSEEITEIRDRLGITYEEKLEEQLGGIERVMKDIAKGAKEGLRDSFEENVSRYVEQIKSGQPKEKVLEGLPKTMIREVERRLFENETTGGKLSIKEIADLIKSVPHIPVAEGSRMLMPDSRILKTKSIKDLSVGDSVYTLHPSNGFVVAEVVSKGDRGQILFKLEDGTNFPTAILGDTYLLRDLETLKANLKDNIVM